ncbi:MAG: SH3 domain-containing protein [Devosia sp.]
MLAATFETLQAPATPSSAAIDDRQLVAAASEPVQPLQPVARMVKTTAIRALTAPASEEPAMAPMALAEISAPAEDAALGAIAEVTATVPAEAEPERAMVEETAPAQPKPSVEPSNTRIVAGQGVNVRSGPGKSQSKLFALAGGTKVTIGENRKGWLEITDSKGRTGWVYKDYLLAS